MMKKMNCRRWIAALCTAALMLAFVPSAAFANDFGFDFGGFDIGGFDVSYDFGGGDFFGYSALSYDYSAPASDFSAFDAGVNLDLGGSEPQNLDVPPLDTGDLNLGSIETQNYDASMQDAGDLNLGNSEMQNFNASMQDASDLNLGGSEPQNLDASPLDTANFDLGSIEMQNYDASMQDAGDLNLGNSEMQNFDVPALDTDNLNLGSIETQNVEDSGLATVLTNDIPDTKLTNDVADTAVTNDAIDTVVTNDVADIAVTNDVPDTVTDTLSDGAADTNFENLTNEITDLSTDALPAPGTRSFAFALSAAIPEEDVISDTAADAVLDAVADVPSEDPLAAPEAPEMPVFTEVALPEAPVMPTKPVKTVVEVTGAPDMPEMPQAPVLDGLNAAEANALIEEYNNAVDAYNAAVDEYNSAAERYNSDADAYNASEEEYEQAAAEYNTRVEQYNRQAEEYNTTYKTYLSAVEAYNSDADAYNEAVAAYQVKQEAYTQAVDAYNAKIAEENEQISQRNAEEKQKEEESAPLYEKYLRQLSTYEQITSQRDLIAKAHEDLILQQEEALGQDMGRITPEDIYDDAGNCKLGEIKDGYLVLDWDTLTQQANPTTLKVTEAETKSGKNIKVLNVHVYMKYNSIYEAYTKSQYYTDYSIDPGQVLDANDGQVSIPVTLLNDMLFLEYEYVEMDANDTVEITNQGAVLSTYSNGLNEDGTINWASSEGSLMTGRYVEGRTNGDYWANDGMYLGNARQTGGSIPGISASYSYNGMYVGETEDTNYYNLYSQCVYNWVPWSKVKAPTAVEKYEAQYEALKDGITAQAAQILAAAEKVTAEEKSIESLTGLTATREVLNPIQLLLRMNRMDKLAETPVEEEQPDVIPAAEEIPSAEPEKVVEPEEVTEHSEEATSEELPVDSAPAIGETPIKVLPVIEEKPVPKAVDEVFPAVADDSSEEIPAAEPVIEELPSEQPASEEPGVDEEPASEEPSPSGEDAEPSEADEVIPAAADDVSKELPIANSELRIDLQPAAFTFETIYAAAEAPVFPRNVNDVLVEISDFGAPLGVAGVYTSLGNCFE